MTDIPFRWDDTFLIGIEELDHEHRVLIDDIERLHTELAGQEEKSKIERCLGDIYARMQAHFALEERVMKERGYQFFDEHKREHEKLLESYTESMLRFLNEPSVNSSDPIEDHLKQWIVDHILTSDKKMSLMIEEKGAVPTKVRNAT